MPGLQFFRRDRSPAVTEARKECPIRIRKGVFLQATKKLIVRKHPSHDSKVVGHVLRGQCFEVIDRDRGAELLKIQTGAGIGPGDKKKKAGDVPEIEGWIDDERTSWEQPRDNSCDSSEDSRSPSRHSHRSRHSAHSRSARSARSASSSKKGKSRDSSRSSSSSVSDSSTESKAERKKRRRMRRQRRRQARSQASSRSRTSCGSHGMGVPYLTQHALVNTIISNVGTPTAVKCLFCKNGGILVEQNCAHARRQWCNWCNQSKEFDVTFYQCNMCGKQMCDQCFGTTCRRGLRPKNIPNNPAYDDQVVINNPYVEAR